MGSKRIYTLSANDMVNYISIPKTITSDIELNWYTRSHKKALTAITYGKAPTYYTTTIQ